MLRLFALMSAPSAPRTRGVYFIMITLAFAQMTYYVAAGLDRYGGDDGLTINRRSQFVGPIDLSNKTLFYYLCFVLAAWRRLSDLAHRQFALRHGAPRRPLERASDADAIGFPIFRYKLTAFVISAAIAAARRSLRQPSTEFVNPVDHELDAPAISS